MGLVRFLLIAMLAGSAHAETLTGRVGCALAWDYPADQTSLVAGFPIFVDGARAAVAPAESRSIPCADIGLDRPGTYALEIFARAKPDSGRTSSKRVAATAELTDPTPPERVSGPLNLQLGD